MKLLIKNGLIVDGNNTTPFSGDLLIDGEKISAIGENLDSAGVDRVIDAKRLTQKPKN